MTRLSERYAVEARIAEGRFGETSAVRDASGAPLVAKRISLRRLLSAKSGRVLESLSGSAALKALELMRREARVLAELSHPSIPRLVDSFEEEVPGDIELVLIQEHAPGRTLLERIRSGPMSEEEAWSILTQVAETLAYLHSRVPPVVHRDLKPANILVSEDGRVSIVDFGAVLDALPDEAGGSTVVGTTGYMPLEQFEGRAVPASDVYALGATLAHLLSGTEPSELPRRGMRIVLADALPISPRLRSLVERMLDPDATRRPADGRALLEAIASPDVRKARWRPLAFAIGGAVASAIAVGVILAVDRTPETVIADPEVRVAAPEEITAERFPDVPPEAVEALTGYAAARMSGECEVAAGFLMNVPDGYVSTCEDLHRGPIAAELRRQSTLDVTRGTRKDASRVVVEFRFAMPDLVDAWTDGFHQNVSEFGRDISAVMSGKEVEPRDGFSPGESALLDSLRAGKMLQKRVTLDAELVQGEGGRWKMNSDPLEAFPPSGPPDMRNLEGKPAGDPE